LHPITEKIWNCFNSKESLDSIITEELKKMAHKIHRIENKTSTGTEVEEIMGLRKSTAKEGFVGEWCEHEYYKYIRQWPLADIIEYCPKCQTVKKKLTQPKPLRERLAEKLHEEYVKPVYVSGTSIYLNMADAAIKFLEENKGDK
jgi:hypothetical protein